MRKIDYLVDFCVHIGQEMLECGANLERVNITIESICRHYGIKEVGLHTMNTMITLSITDAEGESACKTVKILSSGINLERLKALAAFAKTVAHTTPDVTTLNQKMQETINGVSIHPWWVMLLAYIVAMLGLARLFGGYWQDLVVTAINTVILYFLSLGFSKLHLNHIITNFINMFIVTSIAALLDKAGFVQNFFVIILTNAFYLIPGIPMVNSVRCLICGNEMNGIIELFKVILECLTIIAGVTASYFFFISFTSIKLEEAFPAGDYIYIAYDIELIVLSFFISAGFGLIFNMSWKEDVIAGVGAMLVRVILIDMFLLAPAYRFVVFIVSAFAADVFSEVMAMYKKCPATYYLYSFVVPLIPGDLVAYTMFGMVWKNTTLFNANCLDCIITLLGISVGLVLASSIMHFVRKIKLKKLFPALNRN